MADFDMHADTPAAATDLAAGDRFAFDDVSANAAAGGFDTLEADDLLHALTLVAAAGTPIRVSSGGIVITPPTEGVIFEMINAKTVTFRRVDETGRNFVFNADNNGLGQTMRSSQVLFINANDGSALIQLRGTHISINDAGNNKDVGFKRSAANTLQIQNGDDNNGGGVVEFFQVADVPTPSANCAVIGAEDVAGTAEMIVADEAGTETQISPHAMDAPAWMYDADDPWPRIDRSIQRYLGLVEFDHVSRRRTLRSKGIAETFDAGLATTCFYSEPLADYCARTGKNKPKLVWSEVQDSHQAQYDTERAAENTLHDEWAAKAAAYPGLLATWTAARDAYVAAVTKYKADLVVWLAKPRATRGPAPVQPTRFTQPQPESPGDEPIVRPTADVRKPCPEWIAERLA